MSETELAAVVDGADMIVNGYAFTLADGNIRILKLRAPFNAAVFSRDGEMLETSMDDIELAIVADYLSRNRDCLDDLHA